MNGLNRLRDDKMTINQQGTDSLKKLKYYTTNTADMINAKDSYNMYGIDLKDGLFVPAKLIDNDSFLRANKKGNTRQKGNYSNNSALPFPTLPARYNVAHGDTTIEDGIRQNPVEPNKNSTNPKDTAFYNRTFSIFNDKNGIETPNALRSVETRQDFGARGGINTRNIYKTSPK